MDKLIRYWNQNRGRIILTIAIIAFIIIVIHVINQILANDRNKSIKTKDLDKAIPIQSAITRKDISIEDAKENVDVIKEFIKFCNEKDYKNAYDLLTDECKEEFNNNINDFIDIYCKNIFKTKKIYELTLWTNVSNVYTYKVKYYEDNLLATGGSDLNENIEDYITLINRKNEIKININGFIGKRNINKSKKVKDVEITISTERIYKNQITYDVTIKNDTSNTILISNKLPNNNICLIDENKAKYVPYIDESLYNNLLIEAGNSYNIRMKFNKIYDTYRIVDAISFNNIILNWEEYNQNTNNVSVETIDINIDI